MITFLILNLLDCFTTFYGIEIGLTEGNFFLNQVLEYNILLGLSIKMGLSLLIALLLIKFKKEKLFKVLNIAFTFIVIWNVIVMILN